MKSVASTTNAAVNNNTDHTVAGGPSFANSLYRVWMVGFYFTGTVDVPTRTRIQFQDSAAPIVYAGISVVGFDAKYIEFPGGLKWTENEPIIARIACSVASIGFRAYAYVTEEFAN